MLYFKLFFVGFYVPGTIFVITLFILFTNAGEISLQNLLFEGMLDI